jgi:sulfur carrier protein ThiS
VIRVGDREHPWRAGMTLADVVRECAEAEDPPVARLGEHYVSRRDFASTPVPDGCEIYLLPTIAGG